jgi:serine/threonine protein kinase
LAREARTTAHIESDHIVQVFDAGVDSSLRVGYIAMELLRGEDLKSALARVGRFEPEVALSLALQAAIGLARAHALGIVHRDVKPANLFLTQRDSGDLCVKVLDFGIAKVRGARDLELSDANSTHGTLVGTPRYMSPEQLRRDENVDARSDVWSLGAVLHEMLSGQPPFARAHSLAELTSAMLSFRPDELASEAPWVSSEISELVRKALAPDPEQRFADCGEFRDALSRLVSDARVQHQALQPLQTSTPPSGPAETPRTAAEPHVSRNETLRSVESGAAAAGENAQSGSRLRSALPLVLAAAMIALFLFAFGNRSEPPRMGATPKSELHSSRNTTREPLVEASPGQPVEVSRAPSGDLEATKPAAAPPTRRSTPPPREVQPRTTPANAPALATSAQVEPVSDRIRTSVDEFK